MADVPARAGPLVCSRCSYRWVQRKDALPKRCPRCRSVKWNEPDLRVTCLRCGHSWNSHDGSPKRCPKCGSHQWNVPLRTFKCLRCGNVWESKGSRSPKRCPACCSRQWNVEPEPESSDEGDRRDAETEKAILSAYRAGKGCVDISIELGVPYSVVRDVVSKDGAASGF